MDDVPGPIEDVDPENIPEEDEKEEEGAEEDEYRCRTTASRKGRSLSSQSMSFRSALVSMVLMPVNSFARCHCPRFAESPETRSCLLPMRMMGTRLAKVEEFPPAAPPLAPPFAPPPLAPSSR